MELQDKVALVTGAGRRIGREIAIGLGRAGADVIVHYGRSAAGAAETADALREMGRRAWTVSADLAEVAAVDALFKGIEKDPGRLDVLVNSAAIFRRQALTEVEPVDWERTMAINLRAPFLCMQRAAVLMTAAGRGGGAIVNLADLSGLSPWPEFSVHGASKAGLLSLTEAAALELGPSVRVNAVVPGAILPPPGASHEDEAWKRRGDRLPLRRTGDPGNVVSAVRFLIENDFVNGAILPIDGGERLVRRMNC